MLFEFVGAYVIVMLLNVRTKTILPLETLRQSEEHYRGVNVLQEKG